MFRDMYKIRRTTLAVIILCFAVFGLIQFFPWSHDDSVRQNTNVLSESTQWSAAATLDKLQIKDKDMANQYNRAYFGSGWTTVSGCDTRNLILYRDLSMVKIDDKCNVITGTLDDPYSGKLIRFVRGSNTSGDIQIDHVVSLSNAWQTGAQLMSLQQRIMFANDPLELLAVDGDTNQDKSDSDASAWLPPNKNFHCQYISRQIAIKQKYKLWVTKAEHNVMHDILSKCPAQLLPSK